jgi:hypothetical protein
MHRFRLAALMGVAALACLTSAAPAGAHAKKPAKKAAVIKTGTYNAKLPASPPSEAQKFNIALKKTKCATAPGSAAALHLCVSVLTSPRLGCTTPVSMEDPLASFLTPVALPASGSLVEHGSVTEPAPIPGGETETGEGTFSIAFTKKGTASGYIEQNLTYSAGQEHGLRCDSGKVSFTAKLG